MTIFNLADILTGVIEAVILFKMYEAETIPNFV